LIVLNTPRSRGGRVARVDFLAQQMAERRDRILAAAREIIGQRGYEALTMRDLARASRVTVPTVYNLVGSKDQVLVAAVEAQTARFEEQLAACAESPPAERVVAVAEAAAEEYLRMPRYYRTLLMLLFFSDSAQALRTRVDAALSVPMSHALTAMQAAGDLAPWVELRPLRARLRAHLLVVAIQWATGTLTDAAMRSASRYGAALLMCAVTVGRARAYFEAVAQSSQTASAAGRGPGTADEPAVAGPGARTTP
jgi:AcrR family transcriptional regulator